MILSNRDRNSLVLNAGLLSGFAIVGIGATLYFGDPAGEWQGWWQLALSELVLFYGLWTIDKLRGEGLTLITFTVGVVPVMWWGPIVQHWIDPNSPQSTWTQPFGLPPSAWALALVALGAFALCAFFSVREISYVLYRGRGRERAAQVLMDGSVARGLAELRNRVNAVVECSDRTTQAELAADAYRSLEAPWASRFVPEMEVVKGVANRRLVLVYKSAEPPDVLVHADVAEVYEWIDSLLEAITNNPVPEGVRASTWMADFERAVIRAERIRKANRAGLPVVRSTS
ncbi:hypothetical protein GS504_01520 [Rhodococcus hoagii]|nr:hypothetical protein [Prescottella equi]NKS71647.1 hypothetical protein [Prescottella equi]